MILKKRRVVICVVGKDWHLVRIRLTTRTLGMKTMM